MIPYSPDGGADTMARVIAPDGCMLPIGAFAYAANPSLMSERSPSAVIDRLRTEVMKATDFKIE